MTRTFDDLMAAIDAGEAPPYDEVTALVQAPDILPLGMAADALRRRVRGTAVTYARVARCSFDEAITDVPSAATEIRLTGTPPTLDDSTAAIERAKAVAAGNRLVSAFSWTDVERLAESGGSTVSAVLDAWRSAGLEALAELPLDRMADATTVVETLVASGYRQLRLTIASAPAAERAALVRRAAELQSRFACIQLLNPLPTVLNAMRPTTGYDDVKTVAMTRLVAANIPVVQVDWLRYGPKLAQVALTFGADDLDEVSPSDDSPDGRRRAPIEEVRRNIEAAGFTPVERDGRFVLIGLDGGATVVKPSTAPAADLK